MRVVYSCRYKQHAKAVIDEVIRRFGSANRYKEETWGKPLEENEVLAIVRSYLDQNKLNVKFFFGKSLVTTMSSSGLSLVGKKHYYRDLRLKSLLDHEIGTHYVRSLNHKNLAPKIKDFRVGWQLATEEGLASISNHVWYEKCDLMYVPAMLYYAVCVAHENSFWDTFKIL